MLTQHLGYGRFQLQDFELGAVVARFDGSLARICDPQPKVPNTDRIQVWVDHGTINARLKKVHRHGMS